MGKYIRKAKTAGEVAVMEVSQSSLGVRTRAKTLALQRLQKSLTTPATAASTPATGDWSYLQLRSRRLKKPPVPFHYHDLKRQKQNQQQQGSKKESCGQNPNPNPNPHPHPNPPVRISRFLPLSDPPFRPLFRRRLKPSKPNRSFYFLLLFLAFLFVFIDIDGESVNCTRNREIGTTREREREREMESGPGSDGGLGSIVWVRRRNGSWWPGKILGPEELPASHLASPRTGTPVKLLGREDASV